MKIVIDCDDAATALKKTVIAHLEVSKDALEAVALLCILLLEFAASVFFKLSNACFQPSTDLFEPFLCVPSALVVCLEALTQDSFNLFTLFL